MSNICHTTIIFKGIDKNLDNLEIAIKKEIKNSSHKKYHNLSFSFIENKIPPYNSTYIYQLLGINDNYFNQEDEKKLNNYLEINNWIGTRESYINERIFESQFERKSNQLNIVLEMAWYCPIAFFIYLAKSFDLDVVISEKVEGNFTHLIYLENTQDKEYNYIEYNVENILNSKKMQDSAISLNLSSPVELLLLAIYKNQELLAKELIIKYSIKEEDVNNCINNLNNLSHEDFYDSYREFLFTNIAQQENFNILLHNLQVNAKSFIAFFN